MYIGNM